jgi:hypothetical protein
MPRTHEPVLAPKSPLLITESAEEFEALRTAFEQEIRPRGIIEHMYVYDIACIVWEILRLRRGKASIINAAFRDAFADVLTKCLTKPGKFQLVRGHAEALTLDWFRGEEGKKRVAEILSQNGLDEYAIEGEAIKRSAAALELLDRMLASLERRRTRALQCIGEYPQLLREPVESSDRVIEGEKVPELEPCAQRGQS